MDYSNNVVSGVLKIFLVIAIILVLIGLYFFDNIKGYYRFMDYCAKEGGVRVYEKLEKNVGWMASDYSDALFVSQIWPVDFVRYKDNVDEKKMYDLYFNDGNKNLNSSYTKKKSSSSKAIIYSWVSKRYQVDDADRLKGFEYLALNKSKNIMVNYSNFSYSLFDQKNTLFGSSSTRWCETVSLSAIKNVKSIFKN
jgi:hypothetical protein